MADRYAKKKKKKSSTTTSFGVQPPNRGHGLQSKTRPVQVSGANGNGTTTSPFLGRVVGRSALTQADRRLIRELTQALQENSALLKAKVEEKEPPVKTKTTKEKGPRPVASEETQSA